MQNKKNSVLRKLAAAVLIVAVVAYVATYLFRPVAKVVRVTHDQAVNAVPASITVIAKYTTELKSEASGRLVNSALELGKTVKEGDFLMQVDPGDLDLDIEHVQAEYETAKRRQTIGSVKKVELDNAHDQLENYTRLFERGNLAKADLDKQKRLVESYKQQIALDEVASQQAVDTLENTLKVKRRQREKMRITSPLEGTISKVLALPGDLIGGAAPIATIISSTRIVEAKISEEYFAGIRVGQQATVRFLGYGEDKYEATVTQILPTADPETQRYIVYLDVKIASQLLVPGITGEASIIVGQRAAKAVVPRRALFGTNLFVVNNGRIELRPVTIGYVSLNQAEILTGVDEGDLIVIEELDSFHNGDRARFNLVK